MSNEAPDNRKKNYMLRRSILDFGMGLIIFCFGLFFLLAPWIGFNFVMEPFYRYFLSGLFMLYGGWRAYRGFKKNYFN